MDALIKKGTNVEFTLSGSTGTVTAIGIRPLASPIQKVRILSCHTRKLIEWSIAEA